MSRDINETWVIFLDVPQLTLHPDVVGAIVSLVKQVLRGEAPDFDTFISRFGTHYAQAITQGRLRIAETGSPC